MGDFETANPRARRLAVSILAIGTIAGVLLITLAQTFRPAFEAWVARDRGVRLRLVIATMILFTSGPILAFAAYLQLLGRRIVRADRYPPPGLPIIRDTPVLNGPRARGRARVIQIFAAFLAAAALLLASSLWRLLP